MQKIKSGIRTFFLSLLIYSLALGPSFAVDTASLLPPGVLQLFDNNGNPLTSGYIYTYEVGTSTLKTTWKDSAEALPNTNPIRLDAGGKAIVYGSGTYRTVVKDRNGNLIWDAVTAPGGGGGSTPTLVGDGNLVGTVLPWSGLIAPNQYVFAYGQEIARATYPTFFTAVTQQLNVICSASSNTLTGLSDTSSIRIGEPIELALCVPAGTTVVSKTAATVVLSNPSNVSINAVATFFPWGNGNGSTTFNVPDYRGYVLAGRTNMGGTASTNLTSTYYGTSPDALGANGGNQSHTLTVAELPTITPAGTISQASFTYSSTNPSGSAGGGNINVIQPTGLGNIVTLNSQTFTGTPFGSNTPHSIIQPTITINYIVKITPDTSTSIATGVFSIGGMTGVIACGTGILCTGNIISALGVDANGPNTAVQFSNNGLFGGVSQFAFISPNTLTLGATSYPTPLSGTVFQVSNTASTSPRIELDSIASAGFVSIQRANNTVISPSALLSGDQIGAYNFHGYGTSAYSGVQASVRAYANQNWTNSNQGTNVKIATTSNNSTTLTDRVQIENDGGVTIPPTVTGGDKGTGTINASGLIYSGGNALAASASSPLSLNSTTGVISCPTCSTTSGGGALIGVSPINVNSNAVSISGQALTKTNDTNVTLTLDTGAATALISPSNLTLGWTGQLAVGRGGTGLSSGTSGGIPYFNSTSTIASSALLTANQIMIGGGAGVAPSTFACATTTTVVHGGTPPTCGQIVNADITTGTISNDRLAQVGALTIKGNPTGSTAGVTDVVNTVARSSSLLNIDQLTTHGDSIYTILNTDRSVFTSATLTAPRTWTLPAANTTNAGQEFTIWDAAGGIISPNNLTLARSGSDTINGTTIAVLSTQFGGFTLKSDGVSKYTYVPASSGGGGGSGTVTNAVIVGAGLVANSGTCNITTSGTCTLTGTSSTKSDQQTGTSTTTIVTPAQQQSHDSAAKVWVAITGSSGAIQASYNVSGVVRNSAGVYTVSFTTAFANTNYMCSVSEESAGSVSTSAGLLPSINNTGRAVGSVQIVFFNVLVSGSADPTTAMLVCYGRQ